MQKNSKFISVKFSNIKILKKLYSFILMLYVPLIAMESPALLKANNTSAKKISYAMICANLLRVTDEFDDVFYRVYRQNLNIITTAESLHLGLDTEITANPFHGVVDLCKTIPPAKKLKGKRAAFGIVEIDALQPTLIEGNLNRFTANTNVIVKRLKDDPKKLEEYITIRSDILRFFKLRAREYHEEKISDVDIMIPVACSTCGSVDCLAAGFCCAAGHPWAALGFCMMGTFKQLFSFGCIFSLATDKEMRSQHFFITDKDVKTISAIKKALKKAHKNQFNENAK